MQLEVCHPLRALEGQGPDVHVLTIAGALHQIDRQADQLLCGEGEVHAEDLGALCQPLVVVQRAEDEELLLLLVPVAADALKNSCAVVQRVGHDAHLGLRRGNKLAAEIG